MEIRELLNKFEAFSSVKNAILQKLQDKTYLVLKKGNDEFYLQFSHTQIKQVSSDFINEKVTKSCMSIVTFLEILNVRENQQALYNNGAIEVYGNKEDNLIVSAMINDFSNFLDS